jgi:putative nucleotidyltransferase with HDIG domain
MTAEEVHRLAVTRAIEMVTAQGNTNFHEILLHSEGADPVLVAEIIREGKYTGSATTAIPAVPTQELLIRLPAPDPRRSQWWFTGESVVGLAKRAMTVANGGRVLCLGTPTVAHELISAGAGTLRTDDQIETAKRNSLTEWATKASPREHPDPSDKFRGRYQRDRDRVLWSHGLRRLAHKTQLFPTEHDDQLRQRLAHSIEVMQLASTIGASFGLDRDLIEAGALAHDIGHTPFGHAGEYALNQLLDEIDSKLGGFNHYEHGVDIVRWLEGPHSVSRTTAFNGLNLTPEVAECIL